MAGKSCRRPAIATLHDDVNECISLVHLRYVPSSTLRAEVVFVRDKFSSRHLLISLLFLAGFLKAEPKIWTANAVGFFVGSLYFLEFIRYAPKRSHTLPGSVLAHFHCVFIVVIGTLVLAVADPSGIIIGHLAVLFCVAMFASPLAALPTVMETKSAKAIPLAYTLAVMANSVLWTVVGILDMHDIHIYVPTLLGLGLSGLQVGLKLAYGNGPDLFTPMAGGNSNMDHSAFFSPLLV